MPAINFFYCNVLGINDANTFDVKALGNGLVDRYSTGIRPIEFLMYARNHTLDFI